MFTRIIWVIVILMMIAPLALSAKEIKGKVTGEDFDGKSSPLESARVIVLDYKLGTLTDNNGEFKLSLPENAKYIVVSYIGYAKDTIDVSNTKEFYPVKLISNVSTDEIEVSAASPDNIRSLGVSNIQTITGRGIRKAACCNLGESFITNPSVDVEFTDAVTGAKQIQLLGLHGTYSQILTEKIPNLRGLSSVYGLSYIPGSWMESISISKGTSTVESGFESITGQINVGFKRPEDSEKLFLNFYGNQNERFEANFNTAHQLGDGVYAMLLGHASTQQHEMDVNNDGFLDQPLVNQINVMGRFRTEGDFHESRSGIKVLHEDRVGGQTGFDPDNNPDNLYGIDIVTKRYEAYTKNGFIFDTEQFQSIGTMASFIHHKQNSTFGTRPYDAEQNSVYLNVNYQTEFDMFMNKEVEHDHDGDGVPDHGDEAHEDEAHQEHGDEVEHDHDGDGIPDHSDEAHEDESHREHGEEVDHDHDGDGVPDHGDEAHEEEAHEEHAEEAHAEEEEHVFEEHYSDEVHHEDPETNFAFSGGFSFQYDNYIETLGDTLMRRNETVPGVYGELKFLGVSNMTLVGGLRADFHNEYGTFYSPRAHASYQFQEGTILRASAGKGFHIANIISENVALLASSRDFVVREQLRPEEAWNYGINLTHDMVLFNWIVTANLDFYRTVFLNQVITDIDQSANKAIFYNLDGESYSNSFQADIVTELFEGMVLSAAYRMNDVKMTIDGELMDKPLSSKHKGFVNLAYSLFGEDEWMFDFTVDIKGGGRLPNTSNNPAEYQLGERYEGFTMLHAQITKDFDIFEVYLGAENLTDYLQPNPVLAADDPWGEYFDSSIVWGPLVGRKFYMGIRYEL
jgi:outer membrane receptor for ferrienterochelin and colicin